MKLHNTQSSFLSHLSQRTFFLLIVTILMSACVTTASNSVRSDYVGVTFAEMQDDFGSDYQVLDTRKNYRRIRWIRHEMVLAGGAGTSQPKLITGVSGVVSSSVPQLRLPETTTLPCVIEAILRPDDVVAWWQASGSGCQQIGSNPGAVKR